jgi:plasmid stabilization system protein ParE
MPRWSPGSVRAGRADVKVQWTQHALDQVTDLGDDLYERSPDRAQAVLERILDRVGALAELPWSGPPWKAVADPTFRRLVVDDYIVI